MASPTNVARPRGARGKSVFERPPRTGHARAGSVFDAAAAAGRPATYSKHEIQPGDLDYEYTMFLMRCFPCLRPKPVQSLPGAAAAAAAAGAAGGVAGGGGGVTGGGRRRTVSVDGDANEWLSAADEDGDAYYWNPRTQASPPLLHTPTTTTTTTICPHPNPPPPFFFV